MPVLYLHHDGGSNDLADQLLAHFGLSISDNYWAQEGLNAFDPATLGASGFATDTLAPAAAPAGGQLLHHLERLPHRCGQGLLQR